MPLPRQEVDATHPEICATNMRSSGGRDHLHPRSNKTTRALGSGRSGTRILDAAEGHRCRRHARLFGRRLDVSDVHLRRPRHAPQFLHGRGRRRLVDRGADRIAIASWKPACANASRFPLHERLSQVRIGGTERARGVVAGDMVHKPRPMVQSAGRAFCPYLHAHMYDYDEARAVRNGQGGAQHHASNNPKAYYKKRFTVDDVCRQRFICKPLHLLDACVETDNADRDM